MDREAAVIRAEMSQTRAELDRKLTQLEARARELRPRELTRRYMPEYFVDQAIGGVLTLVGLRLAWNRYRRRLNERERIRLAVANYPRWQ
jgi:hypothetical protein